MLSDEDNKLLCHTGPGTPMGNLIRQYWIPALLSSELPNPDCSPVRVRILNEDLIAFRVTSGEPALIANSCPHRGASLFFARSEEDSLRCVYHGWKFDIQGRCIEMPSEPSESNFKEKVHATVYPCRERNGIIWTYMGPRNEPPSLPDLEPNMLPEGRWKVTKILHESNWFQALEGDIDTVHVGFLHMGSDNLDSFRAGLGLSDKRPGSMSYLTISDRQPRYSVIDTDFGTSYGAYRPVDETMQYWRIGHYLLPFYTMIPTGILGKQILVRAWVPVDDENMMFWAISAVDESGIAPDGVGIVEYLPNSSHWLGKFRPAENKRNDYLIDREAQRTKSYSGIESGAHQQDLAVTESMGVIANRHAEHLGTSDVMVIRSRRKVIDAAKALRDKGVVPLGVDQPFIYRRRSGGTFLSRSTDWVDGTRHLQEAFVQHPEEVLRETI